jgi:ABC-2 type transport system permease protein
VTADAPRLTRGRPVRDRLATLVETGLREYVRTPVLIGLLLFLPAYFEGFLLFVLPSESLPVAIPGGERAVVEMAHLYGVLLVPMMAGLVGGLAGLFVTLTARDADARLLAAGYRPAELVGARYLLVAVAGLVSTAVSLGILAVAYVPEHLGWFVVAALVAALTYGMVGTVAGLVVGRLAGVYLVLVTPMIDLLFFQNPTVADPAWIAAYLPGRFAADLAVAAGFGDAVDLGFVGWEAASLPLALVAATTAFYWRVVR